MDPDLNTAASRLKIVAWLYVMVGTYALIEEVVRLFMPLQNQVLDWSIYGAGFRFNITPILLLLGMGLLKKNEICRKLSILFSWIMIALAGLVLLMLALALLEVGEMGFKPVPDQAFGDETAQSLGMLLIGLPLFIWQFRTLRAPEIKELTAKKS